MSGSARAGTTRREACMRTTRPDITHCAFSRTRPGHLCSTLTNDSHGCRQYGSFGKGKKKGNRRSLDPPARRSSDGAPPRGLFGMTSSKLWVLDGGRRFNGRKSTKECSLADSILCDGAFLRTRDLRTVPLFDFPCLPKSALLSWERKSSVRLGAQSFLALRGREIRGAPCELIPNESTAAERPPRPRAGC